MRILIADDETPIREWIQFSIERGNNPDFEIVGTAENGNEALKLAMEYKVDVIITDIRMPGMDGLTLMKKLHKEMPGVSFIILTNYAEFSYAREAILYGAKNYLLKSEMRGEDILKALSELSISLKKQQKDNEAGCNSQEYLDIYHCYYQEEDGERIRDFWIGHGFKEELDFQVLAFDREKKQKLEQMMDIFKKNGKSHLLRPILHQNYIFLILQAERAEVLEQDVRIFRSLLEQENGGILAVSKMSRGAEDIHSRIEEAEKLMQYHFFFEKGYFTEEIGEKWKPLNRDELKQKQRMLMDNILKEEEEDILLSVQEWFAAIVQEPFHRKDIGWAREICMKTLMYMEEILNEELPDVQEEYETRTLESMSECESLCRKMIEKLYSDEKSGYSQITREMILYIHRNYGDSKLSLGEVARVMYRSPEYLSRLFKGETGRNFSAYLTEYRLKRAKELLAGTDMKIYEVAYTVGYANPSYFSKVYHEVMGMTPEMTRNRKC